jgi:hypothetical protein
MRVANSNWCRRDRRRFLACLAATGDPWLAAQDVGRTLAAALELRGADAEFAQGWAQAVDIAWELVETRVLMRLLASEDGVPASARLLDSKLALAVLQRRALVGAAVADGRSPVADDEVARVRAEIRALARRQAGRDEPGIPQD